MKKDLVIGALVSTAILIGVIVGSVISSQRVHRAIYNKAIHDCDSSLHIKDTTVIHKSPKQ